MDASVIAEEEGGVVSTLPLEKPPKKKITKKTVSLYIFVGAFLAWPAIQFSIFYVYMNFNNIMLAFKGMNTDYSTYWLKDDLLGNFKAVFQGLDGEKLSICFKNNISMFIWTTLLGLPLNLLFSFYLYKKQLGHSVIRLVYMLPHMVSGLVITMLFKQFVDYAIPVLVGKELNLLQDNGFPLQVFYSLWLGFSTSIIIYSNAMYGVDEGMVEAAKIDGATTFQELTKIIIPNIMPTISTYMITGVSSIFTISGSLFLFYGIGAAPKDTYMMGFYMLELSQGELTAYPRAAAISVIITLITCPITFLVRWLLDRFDPLRDVYDKIGG